MKNLSQFLKTNWKRVLLLILIVWALESFSYFVVATWSGEIHGGVSKALNLQLPIDKIIPWFTPLFLIYMPLPFIWILLFAIIFYLADGKRGLYKYFSISLMMYAVGTIVYFVTPTVTLPEQFIDGTIQTLPKNSMFYNQIIQLDSSSLNVFGSFPSYHNAWAGMTVLSGIMAFVNHKKWFGILFVAYGLTITISTLVLHQHALLDAVFTYALVAIFFLIDYRCGLSKWLSNCKKEDFNIVESV
jgi:hypothetical protein